MNCNYKFKKGDKAGSQCQEPAKEHGYCTQHLKNKSIISYLTLSGKTITQTTADELNNTIKEFKELPDDSREPTHQEVVQEVQTAQQELFGPPKLFKPQFKTFEEAFSTALNSNEPISDEKFEEIYNLPIADQKEPEPTPQPKIAPKVVKKVQIKPLPEPAPQPILNKTQKSAKDFLTVGVYCASSTIEMLTPKKKLAGYTQTVMTNPILDNTLEDMAKEYELPLGTLGPEYRLIMILSATAIETYKKNAACIEKQEAAQPLQPEAKVSNPAPPPTQPAPEVKTPQEVRAPMETAKEDNERLEAEFRAKARNMVADATPIAPAGFTIVPNGLPFPLRQ
jgi:hypothetical protein